MIEDGSREGSYVRLKWNPRPFLGCHPSADGLGYEDQLEIDDPLRIIDLAVTACPRVAEYFVAREAVQRAHGAFKEFELLRYSRPPTATDGSTQTIERIPRLYIGNRSWIDDLTACMAHWCLEVVRMAIPKLPAQISRSCRDRLTDLVVAPSGERLERARVEVETEMERRETQSKGGPGGPPPIEGAKSMPDSHQALDRADKPSEFVLTTEVIKAEKWKEKGMSPSRSTVQHWEKKAKEQNRFRLVGGQNAMNREWLRGGYWNAWSSRRVMNSRNDSL
jgi:hypothetical protein